MRKVLIGLLFGATLWAQRIPGPGGKIPSGGGGSPMFVGAANANPTPVTGVYTGPTINAVTGNTIIVAFGYNSNVSGTWTVTDTALNTYTQINNSGSVGAGFAAIYLFAATNVTGNASDVIVVTQVGLSVNLGMVILQASGVTTLDQQSVCTTVGGSGTNQSPSVTTTSANEIVVAGIYDFYNGDTITAGSGYTIPSGGTVAFGAAGGQMAIQYQIVSSTGSFTSPFNIAGTNYTVTGQATYK